MPSGSSSAKTPAKEDLIEVVDSRNFSLAVLPRNQVHLQGLYHRSVAVLAYDLNNRIFLQKRAAGKSVYPGRWDLSATGHVLAGEAAMDAAFREAEEEIGIVPRRLKLVHTIPGSRETNCEFVYLYSAGKTASHPRLNPDEVEDGVFLNQNDLDVLVKEFPEILTPGLVYLWRLGLVFN